MTVEAEKLDNLNPSSINKRINQIPVEFRLCFPEPHNHNNNLSKTRSCAYRTCNEKSNSLSFFVESYARPPAFIVHPVTIGRLGAADVPRDKDRLADLVSTGLGIWHRRYLADPQVLPWGGKKVAGANGKG
jgi:hypothetical protein